MSEKIETDSKFHFKELQTAKSHQNVSSSQQLPISYAPNLSKNHLFFFKPIFKGHQGILFKGPSQFFIQ